MDSLLNDGVSVQSAGSALAQEPKYSTLVGLVYIFNLIVGTGALAIPRAFQDAGYVLGLIILITLSIISYITLTFVIECMSSANALMESLRVSNSKKIAIHAADDSEQFDSDLDTAEQAPLLNTIEVLPAKPEYFEISNRVEFGHMASLFLSRWGEYFFYGCLMLYLFGDLAIYSTVVPKSLKHVVCTYVSPSMSNSSCTSNETIDDNLPCWKNGPTVLTRHTVYRLFVICFGVLLGPFVFFNVSKTKFLQLLTTTFRWTAFLLMLVLTLRLLAQNEGTGNPRMFNFNSFGSLFGVCVYAFMCQHSLPAIVTPFRSKSHLYAAIFVVYIIVLMFYSSLAVTGVFSFAEINDVYTLNFQAGCGSSKVSGTPVFGYFLALFPVFTLSTSFPIIGVTLRNNIRKLLFPDRQSSLKPHAISSDPVRSRLIESDSDQESIETRETENLAKVGESSSFALQRNKKRWAIENIAVPLVVIILPLGIALITDDVEFLVSITGSFAGVGVQYIMPAMLLLSARKKLEKKIDLKVPPKYASPFRHIFWCYFVFLFAAITVAIVIVNLVIGKKF